jgi:MATE family multidrug resistance protein
MTDTYFLKFVSLEAQDACILSGNAFVLFLVFLIGIAQGLTPKIAEAHVNGRENLKAILLKNSMALNLLTSVILYLVILLCLPFLDQMDQPTDVVVLARPFLNIIAASLIPLSIFFGLKQYCEGLSNTRASMYISISANVLNVILNYALIFGKLGFPEIGYLGAAWATFTSRVFMAVAFIVYIYSQPKLKGIVPLFRRARLAKTEFMLLFHMGIGPATQYTFEVAAFVIAGFMTGWLGKVPFAAHGIALSIAAFTYMFASGVSGASSIRVATFKGKSNPENIRIAGFTGFGIAASIMAFFGLMFVLFNRVLPAFFTQLPDVQMLSSGLLLVAALFQLFDGVQVTALGILRGLSDVKIPTLVALTAYWLIALPAAYLVGFKAGYGIYGIWVGLSLGLIFAAVALFLRFKQLIKV